MNKMMQYVLSNLANGRGAYADLTGGEAYCEATKACSALIAQGHISRDLKLTEAGRAAYAAGTPALA